MQGIDPSTGQTAELPETAIDSLPAVYSELEAAQACWGRLEVKQRVKILATLVNPLRTDKEDLAQAIASEMGKPIVLARIEIDRTIDEMEHMLAIAEESLASHSAPQGYVRYDPLGVVAVISPWNFPFLLPLRSIVPALLAGNTVLFKPSELTLSCGQLLARQFERLREYTTQPIFSAVYGDKGLGAAVVELPVRAVCFTGSSFVGKRIAAASATTLKRLVLELGGLDAAIVLNDADICDAAKRLVLRNAANSGQVCNAVKRVYVQRSRYAEFLQIASEASRAIVIGNPLEETTEMGPLVSESQLARVKAFIADACQKGATVVCGGEQLQRPGFFLQHTVLADVPADAWLLREEPFGPVLPVIPFDTIDDAVVMANDTVFGLTASVWTSDSAVAENLVSPD